MIREVRKEDFNELMSLYMQLHNNPMPEQTEEIMKLWEQIIEKED